MLGALASKRYTGLSSSGCVLFLVACGVSALAHWSPGPHPDPHQILNEAQDDAIAGRYEDALAKHVWFHENALTYAPAMYGVRLSFALSYWANLGAKYPPALEKLRAIRDKAGDDVRAGSDDASLTTDCAKPGVRERFHDFAAINETLGDNSKTSVLFIWLDSNRPRLAAAVYDVAEPALIETKDFKLCGKYLDPEKSFQRALRLREESMKATASFGGDRDELERLNMINDEMFARSTATVVALLVINGRRAEAEQIITKAKRVRDDPEFDRQLIRALKGEIPAAWP